MKFLVLACFLTSVSVSARDITYFAGDDTMKSPDGKIVYNSSPKLLKRSVDRDAQIILEEVVLKEYRGKFVVQQLQLDVVDSNFKISTGSYEGKGQFFGVPWLWTAWITHFELPDGARIKVIDYMNASSLEAIAEYRDSAGKLTAVTFTSMQKIEEAAYEVYKSKLLKH